MAPFGRSVRPVSILFCAVLLMALAPATSAVAAGPEGSVIIANDGQFDAAHGVRRGTGTKQNPYVIEGWELQQLEIHDTTRHVLIRNNIIGTLTLNWIGDRATVVRNRIRDLRVNENVKRTGTATDGMITNNRFDQVGQLRHYDGVFANNVVGTPENGSTETYAISTTHRRIANLDGFNGARYVDNLFYGYVETRLHGHHHSSGFQDNSHYHGNEPRGESLTHMQRYHSMTFRGNRIVSEGPYGLIFTDSNHSANDRTATSETNEALNDPHAHHTKVLIENNELVGSGIVVDIFNAEDSKHLRSVTGHMTIQRNDIKVQEYRHTVNAWDEPAVGIEVRDANDLHLTIADNQIAGPSKQQTVVSDAANGFVGAGIKLVRVKGAAIHLMDNMVANRQVGVLAREFTRVDWWIHGLKTDAVATEVDYDNSSSEPRGRP